LSCVGRLPGVGGLGGGKRVRVFALAHQADKILTIQSRLATG
jgi:hypothetical protein